MLEKLQYPVQPYEVKGYRFGQCVRSRILLWARHLGEDIVLPSGTAVAAIGEGEVVWSQMRPGSLEKRNWGGIVVVRHVHKQTNQPFFSLYGHIKELRVKVGDSVTAGQVLGHVAEGYSTENGWWKISHLHFAIYMGPWTEAVLPGYKRFFDGRTRFSWWRSPQQFIEEYNRV
ncbi:MAG: M23 family metallopeptidase [Candidatus Andersenbacteria bacterium]|nr:M23 family metallopeptidase [Candidatus Andersenbacteria bacterium]